MTTTEQIDAAEAELEALANKASEVLERVTAPARLTVVRAELNNVGIMDSRRRLDASYDIFEAAQIQLRAAQAAERDAQSIYDTTLTEAEWTVGDGRFVVHANKTYLVPEGYTVPPLDDGAKYVPGPEAKAVTADEKRAWIAAEAKKAGPVVVAAKALRKAEEATYTARDAVTVADKRVGGCRADLEACTATVLCLTQAIRARETE